MTSLGLLKPQEHALQGEGMGSVCPTLRYFNFSPCSQSLLDFLCASSPPLKFDLFIISKNNEIGHSCKRYPQVRHSEGPRWPWAPCSPETRPRSTIRYCENCFLPEGFPLGFHGTSASDTALFTGLYEGGLSRPWRRNPVLPCLPSNPEVTGTPFCIAWHLASKCPHSLEGKGPTYLPLPGYHAAHSAQKITTK